MAAKEETMRLLCSHGGRLVPCGPGGGLRYVGGETRALVVPREVPFRELRARLAEKAGAGAVTAVRYRLYDEGLDEDLLVSVTSDEELAHMRDEYDHLKAMRPSASFRVFVSSTAAGVQQRRPPVAPPMMRRARSELELAWLAAAPPMRQVHSAQELAAGGSHLHQCLYDRRRQSCCCCCCYRRRDQCAPMPVGTAGAPAVAHVQERQRRRPRSCEGGHAASLDNSFSSQFLSSEIRSEAVNSCNCNYNILVVQYYIGRCGLVLAT